MIDIKKNGNQNKAGVAILTLDNTDFKTKKCNEIKKALHMIKWSIQQE